MTDIESAKRCFYDALALLDRGDYRNGTLRLREALNFAPDNISILTNLAGVLLMQGSLAECRGVANRILALDGGNLTARLVVTECLAKEGRYAELLPALDAIMALEPRVAEHRVNCSLAFSRLGRHAEALVSADEAIALKPDFAAAHLHRGNSLADLKRTDEAIASFERAVSLDPRLAEAWLGLGNTLAVCDRRDEAFAAYDRAHSLNPGLAQAWLGRANLLALAGRSDDALTAYDKAIGADPGLAAAWLGRGGILAALNRPQDALAAYDRALELDRGLARAWLGRGKLLAARRDAEAFRAFDEALAIAPDLAEAWLGRANLLAILQCYDEAATAYENAIAAAPDLAEAWLGRATIETVRRRFAEAIAAYDAALKIDSKLGYARGARLVALMHLCDWSRYDAERADVLSGVRQGARVAAPFDLIGVATAPAHQLACSRTFAADRVPQTAPARRFERRHPGDRINVAYLSADYRYHPVSMLLAGLFEHHDRARFRTTAISFGPDDDSAMRRRIKDAFDRFVDADPLSDSAVIDLIADEDTDIAVDLTGFTSGCRPAILAARAAPVQVNYLGFPAIMGAPYIDYIIADSTVVPRALEPHYSERIVRLPDTFQANDGRRPFPPRIPTRREAGLPEDAFVFCSFNSLSKITPDVFSAWMRLLRGTDGSVLWLLAEGAASEQNLRREAAARGVAPERLVFAPRTAYAEYLARYRAADLFLDTFPFNGGATVSDSLWMGLPVVTLSGETFASRMGASLLGAAGLAELATQTIGDYERLALALAAERPRLAALRAKLVAGRPTLPLFDTARFCRHIEAAYVAMVERHRRGEPPAGFSVAPINTE